AADLVHLIREPDGEPDGALILNHGRGTSEHALYALVYELAPERRLVGVTPGAPLTNVPPGGRHWYLVPRVGYPDPVTFAGSYAALTGFLDGLLRARGVESSRAAGAARGGGGSLRARGGRGCGGGGGGVAGGGAGGAPPPPRLDSGVER